jgi:hypothetical protein
METTIIERIKELIEDNDVKEDVNSVSFHFH